MKKSRKSPIAKALINNSISAYYSAIEIHNKPNFKYRYEIVIILIINSWELLLKGFIYKFRKKVKLFYKDGSTKTFLECLKFVTQDLGVEYIATSKNLELLYQYRNNAVHFYNQNIDIIVYSLIAKNVKLYNSFLLKHFKINLSESSELILLPIGFKKPISPIDFISNQSINNNASKPVKDYIESIIKAATILNEDGIEDSILIDFKINLINVNNISNADIIAAVNNTSKQQVNFNVIKPSKIFKVSKNEDAQAVTITRDKSISQALLMHEQLAEGIFEDVNNIIDANEKLRNGKKEFMLGENIYYRIYSERENINSNKEIFEILADTAFKKFYSPSYYWLSNLPPSSIAKIIFDNLINFKSPHINSLIRLIILLGEPAMEWLNKKFEIELKHIVQKPNFYYSFIEVYRKKTVSDLKLKALRMTKSKVLQLPPSNNMTIEYLIANNNECKIELSKTCMNIFDGHKEFRSEARILDILSYGDNLIEKSEKIFTEIKNLEN